jgi:hypothetical protein
MQSFRKVCVAIENNGGVERGGYGELVRLGLVSVVHTPAHESFMVDLQSSVLFDQHSKVDYFKGDTLKLTPYGEELKNYISLVLTVDKSSEV